MKPVFELKSARLDAFTLRLQSEQLNEIREFLAQNAEKFQMFTAKPWILDATILNSENKETLPEIVALFAEYHFPIIGLRHAERDWANEAKSLKLWWLPEKNTENHTETPPENEANPEKNLNKNSETNTEENTHKNNEILPENETNTEQNPPIPQAHPTVVITTPIRTGQQVYAEKADLIVLGMVSEGAAVIADGNIHIYAPMRGRALAGESGDKKARIFMQSMQAELVSIAGIYRVFEQDLSPSLHKKPVQIELQDDGKLSISAINAQ